MKRINFVVPLPEKGGTFKIENYTIFVNPIDYNSAFIVTFAEMVIEKGDFNLETGKVTTVDNERAKEFDSVWFKEGELGVIFNFDEETIGFVVDVS